MKKKIYKGFLIGFAIALASCSSELDLEPQGNVSTEQISQDPTALDKAVNGLYYDLAITGSAGTTSHSDFGLYSLKVGADLLSNDVIQVKQQHLGFYYDYTGEVSSGYGSSLVWRTLYSKIFVINGLVESIEKTGINEGNKFAYGQLLALRAYSYFFLSRFYSKTYVGNENTLSVPAVYTTEDQSKGLPRATLKDLYTRILSDIETAIEKLDGYKTPSKVQIDQRAAKAIAADIYLETGDFAKAAEYAHQAKEGLSLAGKELYTSTGFSDINNPETIWGFDSNSSTISGRNYYATLFSQFDSTNEGYAGAARIYKSIDKRLYDAIKETDYRKEVFNGDSTIDYYYAAAGKLKKNIPPYANLKFKDPTLFQGDLLYIRASLLYFIEAEALARLGREADARAVLFDLVSKRDTAYQLSTQSGQNLIDEILLQKRIELWGEGYAWFDLKRNHLALVRDYPDSNHTFGKFNLPADSPKFLFQIPDFEVSNNPAIVQNKY
ncbi:RagB/SusD family nutrient uptake outer membrane protein [Ornithobacterium rhinotracheale]|uniref:RagB/SusD family nutrient uptake outer membrane protein n=1 Tax=Ornithobacterium rhinotracheale TaxID=28251 RepID=UPI003FA46934